MREQHSPYLLYDKERLAKWWKIITIFTTAHAGVDQLKFDQLALAWIDSSHYSKTQLHLSRAQKLFARNCGQFTQVTVNIISNYIHSTKNFSILFGILFCISRFDDTFEHKWVFMGRPKSGWRNKLYIVWQPDKHSFMYDFVEKKNTKKSIPSFKRQQI